jgi:thiamine transporter
MRNTRVLAMVETALCVALAIGLSRLPAYKLPYGGSLSLEMLPIMVIALRRGFRAGVIAGVLTSVAVFLFEPFVVHWAQVALDYPVAFGAVGLAAVGARAWRSAVTKGAMTTAAWTVVAPACLMAGALRFSSHFLSGIIFFGSYAPKGQPVVIYSLVYNASYMVPATIACAIATALLLPALERAVPAAGRA